MRQLIKSFLWIGCLAWGLQSAWAFSLLGPVGNGGDAWQSPVNGYNPLGPSDAAYGGLLDLLGTGPKNIGEGYRRNTPVMYYAFGPSFSDFFGSNGEYAVQEAFDLVNGVFNGQGNTPLFIIKPNLGVLGDSLNGPTITLSPTNGIDSYNADLTGFPLNSEVENYQAETLSLLDLKSQTLAIIMEQLGLADAIRYTWGLHDRIVVPGSTCPNMIYTVDQRNFDIVPSPLNQVQYSPYVNGELYNYWIYENCGASVISPPDAAALPLPEDPTVNNPPVASAGMGIGFFSSGFFFTGLTRDDVAGLRWLYSTNNYDTPSPAYRESPAAGSALMSYSTPQVLYTSNYNALVAISMTNDLATLQAQFPGIQFNYVTNYLSNVVSQVLTYVTNYPYGGVAGQGYIGLQTNYTTNIVDFYKYTFGNVVVNSNYPTTTYRYQTITVGPPIGSPVGSPFVTNVTYSAPFQSNIVSGDYFVITNGACPPTFLETLQTNVTIVTNTLVTTTNALATTTNGTSIVQNLVSYFTNYAFAVKYCAFTTNAPADYQGIGRMQFIRVRDDDYDYLSGLLTTPITNEYTMVMITNGQYVTRKFQRVLTTPDFLFSAQDLASGPAGLPVGPTYVRAVNFNTANIQPGLAGPGTIDPGASNTIVLTKVGTLYENQYPLLNGPPGLGYVSFLWGSFNGTTNAPVVYPNGTSLVNLANEAVSGIHISPVVLPEGTNGVPYSATLTASGGITPYSWSLAPASAGLPSGLALSSTNSELMISGTPTQSGTFENVQIQVTDTETPPRTVQTVYSLTIH